MPDFKQRVPLTLTEIMALDGKCLPDTQRIVDHARKSIELASELPDSEAVMVANIIKVAEDKGRLTYCRVKIKSCPACGKSGGYYQFTRSSRNHRKGDKDFSNPILFDGYDLDRGFIMIQNHIGTGFCCECAERIKPVLLRHLDGIMAEIPQGLSGEPPKWRWFYKRRCKKCGWEGSEHLMGKSLTLMADGYFPSTCPQCSAKNSFGTTVVEIADGFCLVRSEEVADA